MVRISRDHRVWWKAFRLHRADNEEPLYGLKTESNTKDFHLKLQHEKTEMGARFESGGSWLQPLRHLLLNLWSFISFVSSSRVPWMLRMTSCNLWPWSGLALPSISAEGGPLSPYDQSYVVVEMSWVPAPLGTLSTIGTELWSLLFLLS